MRALIVEDGFQRGALAGARALAAAGWKVGIGSPVAGGFAASSRFAAWRHQVPPPADTEFLAAVRAAIDARGYDVVFPVGDGEVLSLSAGRAEVPAVVPYAAHTVVARALDKVALAAAAERVGFPLPGAEGDGPFIVKPGVTAAPGSPRMYARIAADRAEAEWQAGELRSLGAEPVVQPFVEGELGALVVVADREGELIAAVQQQAERIWPARTGGSVRARTVPVDSGLQRRVEALLRELGWFGLAQVQFQVPRGGEPVLIDLNGRFYGSLSLALASGVNLPAIWAALATGRELPEIPAARVGVRYHWLEADLRRALVERKDFAGTFAYATRARHGLWTARDPGPAARHAGRLVLRAARRLRRGS